MPFLVTVTNSCNCNPSTCESDDLLYHETRCNVFRVPRSERGHRRAVATLEEARAAVRAAVLEVGKTIGFEAIADLYGTPAQFVRTAVPESGGTIGPLPDGTTIEVEPVAGGWYYLADAAGIADYHITAALADDGDLNARREICDAFNAKQAGQ